MAERARPLARSAPGFHSGASTELLHGRRDGLVFWEGGCRRRPARGGDPGDHVVRLPRAMAGSADSPITGDRREAVQAAICWD